MCLLRVFISLDGYLGGGVVGPYAGCVWYIGRGYGVASAYLRNGCGRSWCG